MPTYVSMGELIATQRKKKNMTQAQLAEKLGVTNKAVSKWERNISYPDTSILQKLGEELNVSVTELLRLKVGDPVSADTGMKFSIFDVVLEVIIVDFGICSTFLSAMDVISVKTGIAMLGFAMFCVGVLLIKKSITPKT